MAYLLMGSSHIEKLRLFLSESNPLQLSGESEVHFHGILGGRILRSDHVKSFETEVGRTKPSRIIIQIGGNDLDSVDIKCDSDNVDIDHIVLVLTKIVALARLFITRFHVEHVAVCQFLFRDKTRHINVKLYNSMVVEANRMLKDMLKFDQQIHYWNLKGLKEREDLFYDGVHLTDRSLLKYFRNIRGAAIHQF